MINHNAIRALYANAFNIIETDESVEVFDKNGNKVEIDLDKVNSWRDPDAYKYERARAYPSFADQFDTIFHEGLDAWKEQIQAIKDKYPKGVK